MSRDILPTQNMPEFQIASKENRKNIGLEKMNRDAITLQGPDQEATELARTEFLERIDFNILRQLFIENYQNCLAKNNEINLLGPERVIFHDALGISGFYDIGGNYIAIPNPVLMQKKLNADYLGSKKHETKVIDQLKKNYGSITLATLSCFIHEETHAISGHTCSGKDLITTSSGYQKENEFIIFDEGVVEKFAREITINYLERTGTSTDETTTLKENLQKNSKELAYSNEVKMIDVIIDRIAEKTGVQKTTVWQAILRGLFEGETLKSPEISELFAQSFGDNFLKDLAHIKNIGVNMKGESPLTMFLKEHSLI